ncbi:(-)-isopiperitenol/(-)-carveol dehydrogenase, mitochondrial-like [Dorcoceras hygrometricum]|uniref:(-)-isopiperitenol/(-)-carveol dehydrogenase, mitochondrial-like n=1 Tax=Dorcoceras hygrometricum TaxID=472368 RepID=A0A2Z7DCJ1_9LAMI|nr:(-)-isopiperitenol/(-)-carveol dehydrogenase, mitochondrial-like [Dorcoceras hygrometricum]
MELVGSRRLDASKIILPAYSSSINLSVMASSLINNVFQVYVDSVLGMEDEGMVAMFESLVSSGLRGFLVCSSAIYEPALVEFFLNATVRDDKVVSTVQGKSVEISEEQFAVNCRQRLKTSCKKREMKFEFRLLNDILAKTIMSNILFKGFKEMVTLGSKQARGFAVQICIILKGSSDLELGESKDFPPLKILTAKTVGKYIAINKNIVVEDVDDMPRVKKTAVKKAVSKKRPAATTGEPVLKKKITLVGRAAPAEKDLAIFTVAQEAVPLQMVSAVTPPAPKRKLKLPVSDDEIVETQQDVENVEQQKTTADDVDKIIAQIITETAEMGT